MVISEQGRIYSASLKIYDLLFENSDGHEGSSYLFSF